MSKSKLNGSVKTKGIGTFTKGAVESFEENIVEQKDYLEKVKKNK
ncbi:MAG: hypothetical protein ACRCVJ_15340 [Clostridium sp.]